MIGNELKVYDGLTSRQQLNLFRNLYYNDGNATEYGIIANAINDCFTADVAPKSEVAREIFEEICEYAEQQIEALIIAEKVDTSGADFFGGGKQAFVLLLDRIAELKKKYTEGKKNEN